MKLPSVNYVKMSKQIKCLKISRSPKQRMSVHRHEVHAPKWGRVGAHEILSPEKEFDFFKKLKTRYPCQLPLTLTQRNGKFIYKQWIPNLT